MISCGMRFAVAANTHTGVCFWLATSQPLTETLFCGVPMVRKFCATIALANRMPHPPVHWVCCVLAACLCESSASLWLNPSVCRRLLLVVVAAEQSPDYFARPSPSPPLRVVVHAVALASLGGHALLSCIMLTVRIHLSVLCRGASTSVPVCYIVMRQAVQCFAHAT